VTVVGSPLFPSQSPHRGRVVVVRRCHHRTLPRSLVSQIWGVALGQNRGHRLTLYRGSVVGRAGVCEVVWGRASAGLVGEGMGC